MEIIQSYGVSYIAQQLQRDRELLSMVSAVPGGHFPYLCEEVRHPPDPMVDANHATH